MKPSLLNRNVVLKKSGLVADNINAEKLKDALLAIFTDSKPIINRLPGILIVYLPDKQFTVTAQYETIAISDDLQGGAGNPDELVKAAIKINGEYNKNLLTAYGINHRYIVEGVDGTKLEKFLDTSTLKSKGVVSSAKKVKAISLSFIENIEHGMEQTMINNLISKDGAYSGNVEFTFNSHNEADGIELPEFDVLKEKIESLQEKNIANINNMLGEK